jgi:hypothetical protein
MHSIFRPGHARGKRQRAANDLCHGMPLRNFVDTANAGLRGNNAFRVASGFAKKANLTTDEHG